MRAKLNCIRGWSIASSGGWPGILFWVTLMLVTGLLLISGYSALVDADKENLRLAASVACQASGRPH